MQSPKPKQWNALEEIHYHFFLIINLPRFQDTPKKNTNIFKLMELFISTRNAEQCRSHHQKKTEKKGVVQVLRKFYQDHYEIRLLDIDHSVKELRQCLNTINPQFLERKNTKIDKQSLVAEFEKNLQSILQVERKDQDSQTYSQIENELSGADMNLGEIPELLFDNTQTSHFKLFIHN